MNGTDEGSQARRNELRSRQHLVPDLIPGPVQETQQSTMMFPVRGDVRLVDGNETLVFTGTQKAISWLNKIFSTLHEKSLPTRLQKYSRKSSSAPSRTLTCSPTEFSAELLNPELNADWSIESPPIKVKRPISREKCARHNSPRPGHAAGGKKAKAWGSPVVSPSYRDRPSSLARQKKSFLRGKRPTTSSPRDSTISSRAKSCERSRPKSPGILSAPQKRKMWSSAQKSSPTESGPGRSGSCEMDAGAPTTSLQRFSITPPKSRERPCRAAATSSRESLSPCGRACGAREARQQVRSRETKLRPPSSCTDDELETPRSFRDQYPLINERMKTLSTSPFSRVARMTISSANRRRPPTSTASMMRRFSTPPKLKPIPEVLIPRPGTPIRPKSPEPMEHKRPWDYTESPTSSTPPQLSERSNFNTSPAQPRKNSPSSPVVLQLRSPLRSPKSPPASAPARPITPITSDFLRTTTSEEDSWTRVVSTPNRRFFKNPLFNKVLERKPSTALHSLAHPEMHEIHESTLKQFSTATRKFISKALTRISKPVENHHGSQLDTTVMCQ